MGQCMNVLADKVEVPCMHSDMHSILHGHIIQQLFLHKKSFYGNFVFLGVLAHKAHEIK